MAARYDAIIVGARCAGSSAAMLLARRGWRVLLLDRVAFPKDTISTHLVQPQGVARLAEWGLLDKLTASGCPPIHTYSFDFDKIQISGSPGTPEMPVAFCPRRTILDKLLVDAAAASGVEIRENCTVENLQFGDSGVIGVKTIMSGKQHSERAQIVIGADGRNSVVARLVRAEQYNEQPPLSALYYAYWSNVSKIDRFEAYNRPNRMISAAPTNDNLTIISVAWPFHEHEKNRIDIQSTYLDALAQVPELADRLSSAHRDTRITGMAVPNYFRKPHGNGWMLIGDAGYSKDPMTAQGIADAFIDGERGADALHRAFGNPDENQALEAYQRLRDERVIRMYELTCRTAKLDPLPERMRQVFEAIREDSDCMDDFVRMSAGTILPTEFWSPKIMQMLVAARRSRT
ncbi:NAD(P)/FAD-dependent oxidoreductase [Bradyrhizobium prioriisuperbiae]|uniref:NAD(P)/FAD-dependent oxidoreductase n=1 Tax=Bradyrhizobium prioriisuperbiae TaxID=2854389 RepID=UPI0028F0FFCB|nr:NAD(P)/FAD-dependent oxidoreductase [Bradyrhizobium prioritasuperba]